MAGVEQQPFVNHHGRLDIFGRNGRRDGKRRVVIQNSVEPQAGGGRTMGAMSHSAASMHGCSSKNHHWNMNKENNTAAIDERLSEPAKRINTNQMGDSSTWA